MFTAEQHGFSSPLETNEQIAQTLAAAALGLVEHHHTKKEKHSSLFKIFHPFALQLPAIIKKHKHLPLQMRLEHVKHDVVELLCYELTSFLKEELRVPLTETLMELEVSPEKLTAWNPYFPNGDMFEQQERAITAAHTHGETEKEKRFRLELAQLHAVFEKIPHAVLLTLQDEEALDEENIPAGWVPFSHPLPVGLCARYSIPENTPAYVGSQVFTVFPQNKKVYKENMAYWCMYSVVYIPSLPKGAQFHLMLNQYFNKFTSADHRRAIHEVQGDARTVAVPQKPTEQDLALSVAIPDATFQTLSQTETIAKINALIGQSSKTHDALARQQRVVAEFQQRSRNILSSAEYLSEVFLFEYQRFVEGRSTTDELEHVIGFAGEAVLQPLLVDGVFDRTTALEKYLTELNPMTRVFSPDYDKRQKELTDQRNSFIGSFRFTNMSGVLKTAGSWAGCIAGTRVGGIRGAEGISGLLQNAEFLSRFGNIQEAVSFFRSSSVTREDLRMAIGGRAENFVPGVCGDKLREKGYKVGCGNHTLIGECGLCYGCELEMQAKDAFSETGKGGQLGETASHKNENLADDSSTPPWWAFLQRKRFGITDSVITVFNVNPDTGRTLH